MQNQQEICGFLLVDKPNGRTSSDCVQEIRNIVGRKNRVGHAGTLDAFATGLLIIGISRAATKHLSDIMILDKMYSARAKLGQLTDTLDLTGIVHNEQDPTIDLEQLQQAIKTLGTGYKQMPPVYSALKYQGKTLSRLARKETLTQEALQKITEAKSRDIHLYSCKLLDFKMPFFSIEAHVSHGTYIRSLMNDIARQCGTHATTHELRRLTIGPFSVDHAKPLRELNSIETIQNNLISIEAMLEILSHYQRKTIIK
jgi:tRNA pseudouridine55 synthase